MSDITNPIALGQWFVVPALGNTLHVLPVSDLREHEQSETCWCLPTPDPDASNVIVHHSMDKREEYEEGRAPS